ncbi:hypothetical protein F2Q70_00015108 [Brassica cretica]|uniref:Transmembrane protein n=1 Tax=Brassica cretica TaxID=69181 RepID=A0A8S9HVH0_BRACR|nr:hypothetical protein F2Q70_00015108 [Brassica cretica]KAF2598354.1 hypothetical protein F2Q68_00008178 [Brassica cretica]
MPLRIRPLSFLFLMLIVCSSSLGKCIPISYFLPFLVFLLCVKSPLIQSFLFAIVKGSVQLEGAKMHESFMLYKSEEVEVKKISSHRKLMFHSTTDYDDAGANPKHDPRRRPGGKP